MVQEIPERMHREARINKTSRYASKWGLKNARGATHISEDNEIREDAVRCGAKKFDGEISHIQILHKEDLPLPSYGNPFFMRCVVEKFLVSREMISFTSAYNHGIIIKFIPIYPHNTQWNIILIFYCITLNSIKRMLT